LFHINEFVLYFFTIVGAIIADTFLGLFKTISLLTILFAVGSGIVAVASIDPLQIPVTPVSLLGLFIVVVASGGIKTNQTVFGGNQFKLPEQESLLTTYFSVQYLFVKGGILAGQILMPVLRNDVKCFEMENCFPLAFGVPSVVMVISFLILLSGYSFYVNVPPTENMLIKVCGCVMVRQPIKVRSMLDDNSPPDCNQKTLHPN
jgi:solute carrier family 15 (oligopeptide transporter), member 1